MRKVSTRNVGRQPTAAAMLMGRLIYEVGFPLVGGADRDGQRPAAPQPVTALGDEDGGAVEAARLEVGQGPVGGVERVLMGGDRQPVRGGERQELAGVRPGVGGDAAQLALLEQVPLVGQRRDVGQVDPGDGEGAAAVERGQRGRTRSPTGAKRIAASSGSGGMSAAPPTKAAPSDRASSCACSPRVITDSVAPWARATCAARWALPPKPYRPSRPPGGRAARFSAR